MTLPPILALVDLIKNNIKSNYRMAEIGCFDGITTKEYLPLLHEYNGHVHIVDWFYGNIGVEGVHKYDIENNVYNTFISNCKNFLDNITIHRGISSEKIKEIPDNSLDLCFIDADHRYNYIYEDIKLCLPKVKNNGIICGHDHDLNTSFNISMLPDTSWLNLDCIHGVHWGVVKAVYDHFGTNINIIPDRYGQCVNLWVKYKHD